MTMLRSHSPRALFGACATALIFLAASALPVLADDDDDDDDDDGDRGRRGGHGEGVANEALAQIAANTALIAELLQRQAEFDRAALAAGVGIPVTIDAKDGHAVVEVKEGTTLLIETIAVADIVGECGVSAGPWGLSYRRSDTGQTTEISSCFGDNNAVARIGTEFVGLGILNFQAERSVTIQGRTKTGLESIMELLPEGARRSTPGTAP